MRAGSENYTLALRSRASIIHLAPARRILAEAAPTWQHGHNGAMLTNESARLKHSRPAPLEGDCFGNVFTYFRSCGALGIDVTLYPFATTISKRTG